MYTKKVWKRGVKTNRNKRTRRRQSLMKWRSLCLAPTTSPPSWLSMATSARSFMWTDTRLCFSSWTASMLLTTAMAPRTRDCAPRNYADESICESSHVSLGCWITCGGSVAHRRCVPHKVEVRQQDDVAFLMTSNEGLASRFGFERKGQTGVGSCEERLGGTLVFQLSPYHRASDLWPCLSPLYEVFMA